MCGIDPDNLFFVDTNVLLYSLDSANPARQEHAARRMYVL